MDLREDSVVSGFTFPCCPRLLKHGESSHFTVSLLMALPTPQHPVRISLSSRIFFIPSLALDSLLRHVFPLFSAGALFGAGKWTDPKALIVLDLSEGLLFPSGRTRSLLFRRCGNPSSPPLACAFLSALHFSKLIGLFFTP